MPSLLPFERQYRYLILPFSFSVKETAGMAAGATVPQTSEQVRPESRAHVQSLPHGWDGSKECAPRSQAQIFQPVAGGSAEGDGGTHGGAPTVPLCR